MGLLDTLKSWGSSLWNNLKSGASSVLGGIKSGIDWLNTSPLGQGIRSVANTVSGLNIPIVSTIARGVGAITSPGVSNAISSAQQALASNNPLQAGQALLGAGRQVYQNVKQQ